jgi:predicted Zn-dependent protease
MAESYYDSPYPGMALVAIKHARQVLPNDSSFFQLQLDYETKFEDAGAALAARQEEVRSNPEDPRNWLALCGAIGRAAQEASAAEKQALADSARASLNEMLAKWPERPEMRVAAATVLRRVGKPLEAAAQLRSELEKAPDDVAALNNLACLLLDDVSPPQPQEALTFSQRAYDLLARAQVLSPSVCDTQGWALIQCGRIDEGVKLLEQTDAQAPSAAIRYHLAEAYIGKSQPAEAQRHLAGAMALAEESRKQGHPTDAALVARLDVVKARIAEMIRMQK